VNPVKLAILTAILLAPTIQAQPAGSTSADFPVPCLDVDFQASRVMGAMGFEPGELRIAAASTAKYTHRFANASWKQAAGRVGQLTKERAGLGARAVEAQFMFFDRAVDGKFGCRAYMRIDYAAYRTGILSSGVQWMESSGAMEALILDLTRNDLVAQGRIKE
jgi:hypothetical protein